MQTVLTLARHECEGPTMRRWMYRCVPLANYANCANRYSRSAMQRRDQLLMIPTPAPTMKTPHCPVPPLYILQLYCPKQRPHHRVILHHRGLDPARHPAWTRTRVLLPHGVFDAQRRELDMWTLERMVFPKDRAPWSPCGAYSCMSINGCAP
jgi:hypothetical protein